MSERNWHRPPQVETIPPAPGLFRSLLFLGAFFGLVGGIWLWRKITNG